MNTRIRNVDRDQIAELKQAAHIYIEDEDVTDDMAYVVEGLPSELQPEEVIELRKALHKVATYEGRGRKFEKRTLEMIGLVKITNEDLVSGYNIARYLKMRGVTGFLGARMLESELSWQSEIIIDESLSELTDS